MDDTKNTIKAYILEEFLPGENPDLLTDTTPLITGGILDSLATLKLIEFLQAHYHIRVEPHETSVEYMDTLPDIAALVHSKM
jgi:acyl carrier protein